MPWKWCLLVGSTLALASAAPATEIALEFDQQPEFALEGPGGSDMAFARYAVSGVEVELEALGSGFGYVDTFGASPGDNVAGGVDANGHMGCGNESSCNPFVATFSIALDAVGVDFLGVGDFSGGNPEILSSGFFLDAWSGPDGSGTLLGSVFDPGGAPGAPLPFGGFALPSSLSVLAPGIRSIVFGGSTLIRDATEDNNLSVVERIRMTLAPEPSPAALLSLGLAGVAWRRRSTRIARGARLVGPERFELSTSRPPVWRANQAALRPERAEV